MIPITGFRSGRTAPDNQPLWRYAAFVWIAMALGSVPTRAQEDTLLVDAVVRLWIQDGPEQVIPALSDNSTMLIPLQRFLELAEIPLVEFAYGDSAVVTIEPGSVPVKFLPVASGAAVAIETGAFFGQRLERRRRRAVLREDAGRKHRKKECRAPQGRFPPGASLAGHA